MRIIQATQQEIIIDGAVPIDEVPPAKKSGKKDSPDPLIRICHKAKKELLEKTGACVAYNISRPKTRGDEHVTKIRFFFSNTGEAKIPSDNFETLCKAEERYCQMMSVLCAERITEYLDNIDYVLGLA
ncbi:hypothetical protein IJI94_03335 [Candidatus Saccharibacteria bacterium]|nr:hypothetical protein [Candidatus Saccharibacteria bacterium]